MNIDQLPLHAASPADLADLAAEAVRALNHATAPGRARLTYPGDVYDTLAVLRRLAERLPQALAQLGEWLDTEVEADRVATDSGTKGALVLAEVQHGLVEAGRGAFALERGLAAAQAAAADLGARREGDRR